MTQDRAEQDLHLSWIFESERRRLLAFIRRRIPDEIDAEDLLQDVFYELVEAYRLMKRVGDFTKLNVAPFAAVRAKAGTSKVVVYVLRRKRLRAGISGHA
jgi:hypothetical protein